MRTRTLAAGVLAATISIGFTGTASAAGDRDCPDFASQADAQAAFDAVPGDPERLDANNNGIACETQAYAAGTARSTGAGAAPQVSAVPNGGVAAGDGTPPTPRPCPTSWVVWRPSAPAVRRSRPGARPAPPPEPPAPPVRHRAPAGDRPDPIGVRAVPAVRIVCVYPPPLVLAGLPTPAPTHLSTPHVTRYGRRRSPGSRAWAGASAVLAAAGMAAVVVLPQDPAHARLDVPVAVVAAPVAAQPTTAAAPAPAAVATVDPAAPIALQLAASEPTRVQIPALGVTSSVMDLGLERDGSMEVPAGAYPIGWFDGSPTPGELGPSVLAGHVDWSGEPGAFYGLRELLPGDEIVIDRADGSRTTFVVDRVEEHPKDEFPSDEVYGDIDHAGLRLITCSGSFDESSGDYLDNVVVFASLVRAD